MNIYGQSINKRQRETKREHIRIAAMIAAMPCGDCGRDHAEGGKIVQPLHADDMWVCEGCAEDWS